MTSRLFAMAAAAMVFAGLVFAETPKSLDAVKQEADLEDRAELAVRYARALVHDAARHYRDGKRDEGAAVLREIQEAVELANESLVQTGKPAWKRSKPFKQVEIATRKLLRDLDDLDRKLGFDERDTLLAVRARIDEMNQKLLMSIMTKPKDQ